MHLSFYRFYVLSSFSRCCFWNCRDWEIMIHDASRNPLLPWPKILSHAEAADENVFFLLVFLKSCGHQKKLMATNTRHIQDNPKAFQLWFRHAQVKPWDGMARGQAWKRRLLPQEQFLEGLPDLFQVELQSYQLIRIARIIVAIIEMPCSSKNKTSWKL